MFCPRICTEHGSFMANGEARYKRIGSPDDGTVPRCKTFCLSGQHYENGQMYPLPWHPPRERIWDMFFFRHMFDRLQHSTFSTELHILVVRGASVKLMDMFGLIGGKDISFFGGGGVQGEEVNTWYSWKEFCNELTTVGHPRIELTCVEQLFLTLDDRESSRLATVWFTFIMFVTIVNLLSMIFPTGPGVVLHIIVEGMLDQESCSEDFRTFCTLIFTFEFVAKAVCIPFVRLELIDVDLALDQLCTDSASVQPFTRRGRCTHWIVHGSNLVDFVSILPFWLTLLLGNFLPNASFLRMIRMARIFRIFKTARNLDMFQVVGLTLWKSISMVVVLFILFALVGLIIGCLLYQLEDQEAFSSVPRAMYWIFVRLLNVKDVPFRDGDVVTTSGIVVLTLTMALKGVLWIVPMEKIKQIYVQEHRTVTTLGDMRREMDEHLMNKTKGSFSVGSTSFAQIHLQPLDWDVISNGATFCTMTLPIMKQCEVVEDVDVTIPHCSGMLIVRMEWNPSANMLAAKPPAMPEGSLVLRVVGAAGFPGHFRQRYRCSFQVPDQLFSTNCQEMLLCLSEPVSFDGPREWDIQWIPRGSKMDNTCTTDASEQPDLLDEGSFRKRTLSLLQEQSVAMHDQGTKLDAQSRLIMEQAERLQRLEIQMQNRVAYPPVPLAATPSSVK